MAAEHIHIILSHPEESRNIGSVCRAMANADLHTLKIVGSRADYDEEQIRVLAIHAYSIWEHAQFYQSITDAARGCTCAAGTTRRVGKKRKHTLILPEELAARAQTIAGGTLAVVFGNERTGLTDAELAECNIGVVIPASESFGSLNLSHAVQIIAYTLFRSRHKRSPGYIPITRERLDGTVRVMTDSLANIGFFSVAGRADMEQFWKDILSRSALSEGEAQYIEKTFTKIAGLAHKAQALTLPEQR